MSCLSFARFVKPDVKAPNSLPIHNLSTGLNYSTIQDGINANETLNGQTIFVDAGTYYESVVVNKSISLIGANSASTIIDGNGTGNVVETTVNGVTLSGFTVRNGGTGVYLDGAVDCNISDNQVTNDLYGIYVYASVSSPTFSVIAGNDIANCNIGISLDEAYNTTITANTIANNTDQGIHSQFSEGNTYFHNNIINNTLQAYNWGESGAWPNTWDNGNSSGGNFWSDYNGNNTNSDGFGNIPYNVGPENIDHYPLMGMFNSFNVTSQYSVETVCNSTISDFQFNGTALLFNVNGENGTTGFCRVSFPTTLINGTLTVFVNQTEVPYTLLPESNSTESYLYFTYSHSTERVTIAPEFPEPLAFALSVFVILLTITIYKKKHKKVLALVLNLTINKAIS